MKFIKSPSTKEFERSVFGFMDLTGNIGGLFEIFEIGGDFLVAIFSGKMFLYSLLSKLYHVEGPESDQSIKNFNNLKNIILDEKSNDMRVQSIEKVCYFW